MQIAMIYMGISTMEKYGDFFSPWCSIFGSSALQLNVDWFQSFEHTQHSEGAVCMSV